MSILFPISIDAVKIDLIYKIFTKKSVIQFQNFYLE